MTRILTRVPDKWRHRLDHWPLWMGIAYFGLVTLIVWLFFVAQHTSQVQANQARADAVRLAETRAAAESSYRRCIESIPSLNRISTHLRGVNDLAHTLVVNSRATLAETAKSDRLYQQRAVNLRRLEAALSRIAAIREFPVPTRQECRERRREVLRSAGG